MNKNYFLFLILLSIFISSAHLEAGEDKVVNGYLIDFGYEPEKIEDKATLVFNLVDDATKVSIEYTSLWMRISKEDKIFFAGTFAPEAGSVALTYSFPEAGEYEITTRFSQADVVLAETNFSITTEGNQDGIGILIAVITLIIILAWVMKEAL